MAIEPFKPYSWMTVQRWLINLWADDNSKGVIGIVAPTVAICTSIMRKTDYPRAMFSTLTPRSMPSVLGTRVDGFLVHPHMLCLAPYPSQGSKATVFYQIRHTLADTREDMLKYRLAVLDIRYQNCLPTDWII